MRDVLIRAKQQ